MLELFKIESFSDFIDLFGRAVVAYQEWNSFIRLAIYVLVLLLIIYLIKKVKFAGTMMSYLIGATIVMQVISLAGFEVAFFEGWLDVFRYILIFWGLG